MAKKDVTPEIRKLIEQVIHRWINSEASHDDRDRESIEMDLYSAEEQLRLDWKRLLGFAEFSFNHDLFQIIRHIDRSRYPGTFPDWFHPRCGFRKTETTKA